MRNPLRFEKKQASTRKKHYIWSRRIYYYKLLNTQYDSKNQEQNMFNTENGHS